MKTGKNISEITQIISMGFFIVVCACCIWFLWKTPTLLACVLLILSAVQLLMIKSKKLIAVYILASLGGSIIESVAIWTGNWKYTAPNFFNIPLWLLPAWGSAAIIIVSLYKLSGKIKFFQKD